MCKTCGVEKPCAEFYARKRNDGEQIPRASCRVCERAWRVECKRRARRKLGAMPRDEWLKKKGAAANARKAERLRLHRQAQERKAQLVARLLLEEPEHAAKTPAALDWLVRYRYDEQFKAREIARAHAKKTRAQGKSLLDDGSLTPSVLTTMFAQAKVCLYCGNRMRSQDKTLDHIIPRSKGGWHSIANAVICCRTCNTKKHSLMPSTWLTRVREDRRRFVVTAWHRVRKEQMEQMWLRA